MMHSKAHARKVWILSVAGMLLLGACAAPTPGADQPPPSPLLDPTHPEMTASAPETFEVLFETTQGDFVVEVTRAWAPIGARRFYNLVRNGYYDGVRFFRVVPEFLVQFGIHGDPTIAEAWREAVVPDDPVRESNRRGFVSFASSGPNTRTAQVFINLADNPRLDAVGFAPFGQVTRGMDVVNRLYAEYGEVPPDGRGPDRARVQAEGEAYLESEFPQLDRVLRARIVEP